MPTALPRRRVYFVLISFFFRVISGSTLLLELPAFCSLLPCASHSRTPSTAGSRRRGAPPYPPWRPSPLCIFAMAGWPRQHIPQYLLWAAALYTFRCFPFQDSRAQGHSHGPAAFAVAIPGKRPTPPKIKQSTVCRLCLSAVQCWVCNVSSQERHSAVASRGACCAQLACRLQLSLPSPASVLGMERF